MPDPAAFQRLFGAMLADPALAPADAALARALAVHRNTAAKAAIDALADNYPVLRALVGEEAFAAAAVGFVAQAPPADPRLCVYGDGFASFLATWPPFADLGYLDDVARVERLVVEALFAADAAPLDGATLAAGVDPDLRLALHPTARIATLAAPGGTIWLAHRANAAPDALERLEWAAQTVLVTRPDEAILVTVLDPAAAMLLHALAAGETIGAAAASAAPLGDIGAAFAALLLAGALRGP